MDIIRLYQDYGIAYQTEGHKHCRPGWVNVECPFCTGNPGLHLGCSLSQAHFYCWRCGWKPAIVALSKILNLREDSIHTIIREYGGIAKVSKTDILPAIPKKPHILPTGTCQLSERHRKYLQRRQFDADRLSAEWGLLATGPIALLDGIDYKHRIIIPFFWNGIQSTFQGRDITDKSKLKYLACPSQREVVHHKHILYGDQLKWGSTGICVEGVTDVWRFGPKAFAVLGIEYTLEQVRVIRKMFKKVIVIFDDEPQARKQASKLVNDLNFRGIKATSHEIVGDPGAMNQNEANYLVKHLLTGT